MQVCTSILKIWDPAYKKRYAAYWRNLNKACVDPVNGLILPFVPRYTIRLGVKYDPHRSEPDNRG